MWRKAVCLSITGCVLFLVVANCSRTGYSNASGLSISWVATETDRVYPGQRFVSVSLRLANRTAGVIDIVEVELRFRQGGTDVGADYLVTVSPENPTQLVGGDEATLIMWVDVSMEAAAGTVEVDAAARGRLLDGSAVTAEGARKPGHWEVIGVALLIVTTADDEDDTSGLPSIDAAGGIRDISFREALLIANSAGEEQIIRFDPSVFLTDIPEEITVEPGLGPLPAITNAGTVIDGREAGVLIDGRELGEGDGLVLEADNITVQGITLRYFKGEESNCIESREADHARILDCVFIGCAQDYDTPGQVALRGGRDFLVSGCMFTDSHNTGLSLIDSPNSAVIINNQMIGNHRDGLFVTGSGHQVTGNLFKENSGDGVRSRELVSVVFRDNQFLGNGGYGVMVGENSIKVTITRCAFGANRSEEIYLDGDVNQGVEPPAITGFDDVLIQGTSAAEGGVIEVYAGGPLNAMSFQDSTEVTGGTWSLELDSAPIAVAATVTTTDGSTSELSEMVVSGSMELVVTTTEDEIDGGSEIITVDQVGGASDLSLREAIVIANNRPGPNRVTFDPVVFPAATETYIFVGAGSAGEGPLPAIRDRGTVIDGTGSSVVLDGGSQNYPDETSLLTVAANDCEIQQISIRNYSSPGGHCILGDYSRRLRVIGCTLVNCGGVSSGSGIRLLSATPQLQISANTIANCHVGISMSYVSNSMISENVIYRTGSSGINLGGSHDLTLLDNRIHDCVGPAINIGSYSYNTVVVGNQMWNNQGTGISVDGTTSGARIFFNTIVLDSVGILLVDSCSNVEITNNLMALNGNYGLETLTSGSWSEHHNLFFDNGGDGDTGVNAIKAGDPTSPHPSDVLDDPRLVDPYNGDLIPQAAAIDSAIDLGYDRNGTAPGLFNGQAPDIGAVETP